MSRVILPKTEDEKKEERKEWREKEKIEKLQTIAKEARLTAERVSYVSSGVRDLGETTSSVIRSIVKLEREVEGLRSDIVVSSVIIMLLLAAIIINLYFY